MKRIYSGLLLFLVLTNFLPGESAWQILPGKDRGQELLQFADRLVQLTRTGEVLTSENGLDWTTSAILGEPGLTIRLGTVMEMGTGVDCITSSSDSETGNSRDSLYRSTDGLNWFKVVDGLSLGAANIELSDPYPLAGGWVIWTTGQAPAAIWQSPDGEQWTRILFDETIGLKETPKASGDDLVLELVDSNTGGWLSSPDGRFWTTYSLQPGLMIEVDGYFIGQNTGPGLSGTIYYSTDAKTWSPVFNAPGPTPTKRLIYANGTFILSSEFSNVYYSADGLEWHEAAISKETIQSLETPIKVTLGYYTGNFWYSLQTTVPPGFPLPDPDHAVFLSADGSAWTEAEWPADFVNEAVIPVANPNFTNPPGPANIPSRFDLPPAREVSIDGYSLLMTEIPEGGRMGLYLKSGDGEYEVVNTSWGMTIQEYPHAEPRQIAAIGGHFVVRTEIGRSGYFDPDANYLAQTTGLKASKADFDDHIHLEWDPVEGAETYRIFRSDSGGDGTANLLAEVSVLEYDDRIDLDLADTYSYQLQSLSAERQSLLSEAVTGRLWSVLYTVPVVGKVGWGDYYYPMYDGQTITSELDYIDILFVQHPFLSLANRTYYPWIYSHDHRWLYCVERPGNLWLWDAQLGWLWTRQTHYPFMYSMDRHGWLYFIAAGEEARWFYDYGLGDYMTLSR